jgi:hypothetical protein
MNTDKLDAALHAAGTRRFEWHGCPNSRHEAHRNLQGRTHYVDPETLKFHKARVISTHLSKDSLLFAIVETCAGDWQNRTRICRSVIFDVFGNVVERVEHAGPADARKYLEAILEGFDAYQHTLSLLRNQVEERLKDAAHILECLNSLEKEEA